jgi:hypothetical protein
MTEPPQKEVTYDARQLFVKELVGRAHKVLDSSMSNPKAWLENLNDFYDFAYPAIGSVKLTAEIREITNLVYSEPTIKNMTTAQFKMRRLFRKIHRLLWKNGLYMPMRDKMDLGKSVLEFG